MVARSRQQRIADVLEKLATEDDLWVASANAVGDTHLIPLSFDWDGTHLIIATLAKSRTRRNLQRAGIARVALGPTRDVVMLEGPVAIITSDDFESTRADAHAQRAGFDPRQEPEAYVYLQVTPRIIQAWRAVDELADRVVMRDGHWL
ncbi:MAG: pyridoxamine 5'-phosphate oxidase family protein [Chloroflexota bacterium]|nr:pyridoxamine 5'-phosphate oxidase family protein [Chloroflexota bacterium]